MHVYWAWYCLPTQYWTVTSSTGLYFTKLRHIFPVVQVFWVHEKCSLNYSIKKNFLWFLWSICFPTSRWLINMGNFDETKELIFLDLLPKGWLNFSSFKAEMDDSVDILNVYNEKHWLIAVSEEVSYTGKMQKHHWPVLHRFHA